MAIEAICAGSLLAKGRWHVARGTAARPHDRRFGAWRPQRLQGGWRWLLMFMMLPLSSGCAWLDTKAHQLALRPTPGRPAGLPSDDQLFRTGDERWLVALPGRAGAAAPAEQVALWWLPHPNSKAPALLYLHGTFRSLYRNLPKINALRDMGFSVLAVDYRGWGDSSAIVPDESTITADALLAFEELRRRQPDPAMRVIYGHSMGGAVAVRLASGLRGRPGAASLPQDYAALVLESTFTSMPDVAASVGVIGRIAGAMTRLDFDSIGRIRRVDAPILMMHGSADNTVPAELGRRLRDAAPSGVRWVEFDGGSHSRLHSDAPLPYAQAFANFFPQFSLRAATPAPAP